MTEARITMRCEDGTLLTPEEEQAVKSRFSATMDEIFWRWEPTRLILDPLFRLWFKEGESCPADLEEIVYATRDLWKLAMVGASEDKRLAQVEEIQRLVLAGFERRRQEGER
jgi:hypothetical protein